MASLRRRKKGSEAGAGPGRPPGRARDDEAAVDERSPFGWALEDKWEEAWRQARRADLR